MCNRVRCSACKLLADWEINTNTELHFAEGAWTFAFTLPCTVAVKEPKCVNRKHPPMHNTFSFSIAWLSLHISIFPQFDDKCNVFYRNQINWTGFEYILVQFVHTRCSELARNSGCRNSSHYSVLLVICLLWTTSLIGDLNEVVTLQRCSILQITDLE